MEKIKSCVLCDESAEIETAKGTGGDRFIVSCSGTCPSYEISRRAAKEVKNKPNRRQAIIEKIKAFHRENPDDLAVIRMINASQEMVVTTRSRESELR